MKLDHLATRAILNASVGVKVLQSSPEQCVSFEALLHETFVVDQDALTCV
jgi:hypothetical protein